MIEPFKIYPEPLPVTIIKRLNMYHYDKYVYHPLKELNWDWKTI